MTVLNEKQGSVHHMVAFQRGEYVLEGIQKFVEEHEIDAGLIVSGIGSLDILKIHYIETTGLPPKDHYVTVEGPVEIGGFQGSIAGGTPHVHIVAFDQSTGQMHIGHLEAGSRCCYRVELGIIALPGLKTRRKEDTDTGLIDIVEA